MWERTRQLMRYAATRDGSSPWAEEVLAIAPGEAERNLVTPDRCLAALRRVANDTTGPLTVQTYEAARQKGEPSSANMQKLFGSWINALHTAGLDDRLSAKARGRIARGEVILQED